MTTVRDVDRAWFAGSDGTLPLGAPFRPGLDPLPARQRAWAVVKDRRGRPAHGEPREALVEITTPLPPPGPNEALGYVLYAGLTYNTIFAARGVPISVFDLHDRDVHVPGSGAVVLVAAVGSEVAREGRVRTGELRVLYPGVSDLLSPRAGSDPMHAEFRIQGYETPDGSFAQFVRCQAPQLLRHSDRLTLPAGASFMLDLETVSKALFDVARLAPGERVFVEGAAGGTGLYAVACAALRGARVTGLVSTDDKGALVVARGALGFVNRTAPDVAGAFTPVTPGAATEIAAWRAAGRALGDRVRAQHAGAPIDVVVSSVGRDLFARMVDLLGPGGRLVFYGATSGYTLTFLGKPGAVPAAEMLRRAAPPPYAGILVHYGAAYHDAIGPASAGDPVGDAAIAAALASGARVVVAARTDTDAARAKAHAVAGIVSLEALARTAGLAWADAMPDYDAAPAAYRAYQDRTLKPFGQAVGRLLATPDNPRGNPDVVVERAAADSLGVSTFLARPFTGVVVYAEDTADRRYSFYAPTVWMHEKRILFPSFSILGSHLSNAFQAEEVVRLIDGGALAIHDPVLGDWPSLADANQTIADNRHRGTLAIRVGAGPPLDGARSARDVYVAWGSRFVDGATVRARIDPVRAGFPESVALVTIDVPPANALGSATFDDLERTLDALEAEPGLRAVVITGAPPMFVAGADIRELRAGPTAEAVTALAARAQRVFARIAGFRAPVVAAIDGYALGGGNELAMACAYRVAAARAELGQPEINLHVIPGFGGTQMLPRLAVRHARRGGGQMYTLLVDALAVLLDGRRRSAARARSIGFVDEVAPADALSHALALARRIATDTAPPALWSPLGDEATVAVPNFETDPEVRRLLAHHADVPRAAPAAAILEVVRAGLSQGLAAGLALEARRFGELTAADEGRAGIDRFLARRSWPLPLRADDR